MYEELDDNRFLGPVNDEGMFMTIEHADEILHRKAMMCKTSFSSKTMSEISRQTGKDYGFDNVYPDSAAPKPEPKYSWVITVIVDPRGDNNQYPDGGLWSSSLGRWLDEKTKTVEIDFSEIETGDDIARALMDDPYPLPDDGMWQARLLVFRNKYGEFTCPTPWDWNKGEQPEDYDEYMNIRYLENGDTAYINLWDRLM